MRITTENAKQLSALANKKRWDDWRAKRNLLLTIASPNALTEQPSETPKISPELGLKDEVRLRVEQQIAKCDELLSDCVDAKEFAMLTRSKRELWQMIYPTAGVLRPVNGKSKSTSPKVE